MEDLIYKTGGVEYFGCQGPLQIIIGQPVIIVDFPIRFKLDNRNIESCEVEIVSYGHEEIAIARISPEGGIVCLEGLYSGRGELKIYPPVGRNPELIEIPIRVLSQEKRIVTNLSPKDF